MRRLVLSATLAALASCGCSAQRPQQQPREDMTSGRITLVCSPEARELIDRCVEAFELLYPKARIEVQTGSSRDAIAALFGARADIAVITRELVPEERRAAVLGRLEVEGYRFARDAAVVVVNPANPVSNMTLDDIRRIYRGDVHRWSELGGQSGPIEPVVQPPDADLTEFFIEEVLGGEPIQAQSIPARSDEDVVRTVREHQGAIGYVTLSHAGQGVRAVRLAALKGLPYYAADLEMVHEGKYPVTRFYNLYVRTNGPALANGLITFVTSIDGQKLVREHGLVPTTVPVRFVRRSPMRSTHSRGDSSHTP
jgi:phosphate transport system substrate-binding protein